MFGVVAGLRRGWKVVSSIDGVYFICGCWYWISKIPGGKIVGCWLLLMKSLLGNHCGDLSFVLFSDFGVGIRAI